jgi:hypothetical protein
MPEKIPDVDTKEGMKQVRQMTARTKAPKTFQNGDLEDEGGTAPTDPSRGRGKSTGGVA